MNTLMVHDADASKRGLFLFLWLEMNVVSMCVLRQEQKDREDLALTTGDARTLDKCQGALVAHGAPN